MKCKLKQLESAMEQFRYSISSSIDADVEVTTREEEFENGTLMSCVTMVVTYKQSPGTYDRGQGEKTITKTIEVFPESENRNSIVTIQERYELKKKD